MSLAEKLVQIKFIRWGFNENYWLWFHILAGIVVAQIQFLRGESFLIAMLTALTVAVGCESIEVVFAMVKMYPKGGYNHGTKATKIQRIKNIISWSFIDSTLQTYKSLERWVYDTAGDIIGTMLAAGLSSLFLLGAIL